MSIKIEFRESISSMAGSFRKGEVRELPDNIAKPWIKSGQAKYADEAERLRVETPPVVEAPKPLEQPTKGRQVKNVTPAAKAAESLD